MLLARFSKIIAALLQRHTSPVAADTAREPATGTPPSPVAGTIPTPEFVNFCGTPMLRMPTGEAAATMLQASCVLVNIPAGHPDRLEMEVRLRRLAGNAETFDAWMRAAAHVERRCQR